MPAVGELIDNPILNGPYEVPNRHFEIDARGGPTGVVIDGRRPSASFVPVPMSRKRRVQQSLDFDTTGERLEANELINTIRSHVELWRRRGYDGVTPYSRKLLTHWADQTRDNRVLFCQREAAETAVFLAEVAGRHNYPDFRRLLAERNVVDNDGLPRVALKMATGSGKTVVMAMLIAWQTINKVHLPRDARFAKRFLVVTPGITIRDRLRVISPSEPDNYYRARDLVPADLWGALRQAELIIANYHAFLPKTAKEMQGVAANTRRILTYGKAVDPFVESDEQIVSRVLRAFGGKGKLAEIVVFNDEAHHCYQNKPLDADESVDAEAKERNEDARVWFKGLRAVARKVGIKTIYDLSATPYYLSGSGYREGTIFPWTISDFSLMDAIESGIVKVPRQPVDDDATDERVAYLNLWEFVGKQLGPRSSKTDAGNGTWSPPATLDGALQSLYRSYAAAFERWERTLAPLGEPPPVMIVVCPNTRVSKLLYEWIAGVDVETGDGDTRARAGALPLLSNVVDGAWLPKPRTILVDSAQLESGEALKDDFKRAAAHEIDAFKAELRARTPGLDIETISDEQLLREVMNTVGKQGRLGEQVRCVVSVAMLTEGWDANTVTHILGIRAFGSQLLCEQVVGRGLRRRDYTVAEATGHFEPEYAEVYGVPFAFIPTDRVLADPKPKTPAIHVRALPDRAARRIVFPRLAGYRVELPPTPLFADFDDPAVHVHVDKTQVATRTVTAGVVGADAEHRVDDGKMRVQQVAFLLANEVLRGGNSNLGLGLALDDDGKATVPLHTRFPQLVALASEWLRRCVTYEPGCDVWMIGNFAEWRARAAERFTESLLRHRAGDADTPAVPEAIVLPVLDAVEPAGSTDAVDFFTRKVVIDTERSPVSGVTLDGVRGNSWEEVVAHLLERHRHVWSYVKNDHLRFEIPYVHAGAAHVYLPDFIVQLAVPDDSTPDGRAPSEHYLIVEVSGTRKDRELAQVKAATADARWCEAVNRHGGFGRWSYVEITDMAYAESRFDAAIERCLQTDFEKAMND